MANYVVIVRVETTQPNIDEAGLTALAVNKLLRPRAQQEGVYVGVFDEDLQGYLEGEDHDCEDREARPV